MEIKYHNVRDKSGKFKSTKRKRATKPAIKKRVLTPKTKHILNVFLLDDTGSMASKVPATVDGFNKVLEDTESVSRNTFVKSTDVLALFGEQGHLIVKDKVERLSGNFTDDGLWYNPNRGRTALWWAVVEAINLTESRLSTQPKGSKVILTIFTDGEDNASATAEHTLAKDLIKAKQEKGWVINFIGAGEKSFIEKMSGSVGIFASNTMNYSNTSTGTTEAFNRMSGSRIRYTTAVADGSDSNVGFFAND